ncbi:MAG: 23S rRNA (guanosine(2251)-2'-O)-methyltransferase RlmB [Syntrophaceae bacterium]|jgi:23S rRNA (guanosine2251-2'-O)-methyltransferase|nr:23S rRNA (guanosine(2251)-2'-O)-methyltransferase RlmB [Syntrophaceae bacterium]
MTIPFANGRQSMEAVYGINPIKVLIAKQKTPLRKIIIAGGRGGLSVKEIIDSARQKKIPVEWKERQYLDELTGRSDHQGIVGFRDSFAYADLDDLLKNRSPHFLQDLILILDSILDPQNLGSIIRSAHCLGANGVIIPTDRAASVTPAVIKASAGSAEQLPVARVTNLSQTIDYLKEKGFWVFGADAHGEKNIRVQNFHSPVVLVLGSESKGIRPLLKKKCDFLVTIPMAGNFDSLNVAVAAGIIQYEIFLQRKEKKTDKRE